MKTTTKFLIFPLIFLISFSFTSCEEEEDDLGFTGDPVWVNQFLYGNTRINGDDVLTSEIETTSTFIRDVVCFENLPTGFLQTFSFNVFIPSSDELQVGFDTNEFIIFYNDTSVSLEPILTFVRTETIGGIEYSKFLVGGQFFEDEITRENFQQLRFGFDMIHRDPDTEEEYNRDGKFIEINFDPC
ncbi:MAG: hypothetical protein WDZ45_01265 [Flavobacteriaceae bacterium]